MVVRKSLRTKKPKPRKIRRATKPSPRVEVPKRKSRRAWLCPKCGVLRPREKGLKKPLCACGTSMRKAKGLSTEDLKKGRISNPQDATRALARQSKSPKALLPPPADNGSAGYVLSCYQNYLYSNKTLFPDLSEWWYRLFPGTDYPEDKRWALIALRLEYQLQFNKIKEEGQIPSARFITNHEALIDMDETGLSATLRQIIDAADLGRKNRIEKKEKSNKEKERRHDEEEISRRSS